MAYYLFQGNYTESAWASLIKKPQDRQDVIRGVVEKLGGTLEGTWLAFGEYDLVAILSLPDNESAAAIAMAVVAGGAVRNAKTTPLMTTLEGVEAMRKAGKCGYKPPK
jgi:uncharacterized protein with GYD domain